MISNVRCTIVFLNREYGHQLIISHWVRYTLCTQLLYIFKENSAGINEV